MPATTKEKLRHSYHTDHSREDCMQAAKHDVEQNETKIHAAARLHQVRPNRIYYKLTSFKSLGSLWDIVGSPAWTCCHQHYVVTPVASAYGDA